MYDADRICTILLAGLLLVVVAGGCATTPRPTADFAVVDSGTVAMPLEDAWQAAKHALREKGLELYTRDKRGVFVAYTPMKRNLFLVPRRTELTVILEPVSNDETGITIETVRQVYGVRLLTYPGWHDRRTSDHSLAAGIMEALDADTAQGEPGAAS